MWWIAKPFVNETGRTLSGAARMIIGGGQKRTIQVPVVMAFVYLAVVLDGFSRRVIG
jgi:hypothetical protein